MANESPPSPLASFLTEMRSFHGLASNASWMAPIIAIVAAIGPPEPPATALVVYTFIVNLLIAFAVFGFANALPAVRHVYVAGAMTLVFFVVLAIYARLADRLIADANGTKVIVGDVLKTDIAEFLRQTNQDESPAALLGKWGAVGEIWTAESVRSARSRLLLTWLLFWGAFAASLASWLVLFGKSAANASRTGQ